MPAKALSAPPTFGQKLARRLHGVIDAIFGGEIDLDQPPVLGQVFAPGHIADSEALAERLREQKQEQREMAVIHEARYILQAQAGAAGNYCTLGDLAQHFRQQRGIDRVELERIIAFCGEPYFERLGERLYLKGHVNG